MVDAIIGRLHDVEFMATLFTMIAAVATVFTLAMPYLSDDLEKRMRAVAIERDRIRARERERLARGQEKIELRKAPKAYMQQAVEQLNLRKWLGEEHVRLTLMRAGYRGQSPYVVYLFFRLVVPLALLFVSALYLFVLAPPDYPAILRFGLVILATYLGLKAPDLFLANTIQRRQFSIRRAFPDALDLLLICVESGMSIETAFQRVSKEIGAQSVELAEELTVATAELAFLPDRRQAYENLAQRVDLEGVKAVSTALVQAERYGTPLGQTLRVLAQENRDLRMSAAEKKAAALPPQLTVPMILFFLPVLFIVILGPAAIKVMAIR